MLFCSLFGEEQRDFLTMYTFTIHLYFCFKIQTSLDPNQKKKKNAKTLKILFQKKKLFEKTAHFCFETLYHFVQEPCLIKKLSRDQQTSLFLSKKKKIVFPIVILIATVLGVYKSTSIQNT